MQFKLSTKVVGGAVKGDTVVVEMENIKNGKIPLKKNSVISTSIGAPRPSAVKIPTIVRI